MEIFVNQTTIQIIKEWAFLHHELLKGRSVRLYTSLDELKDCGPLILVDVFEPNLSKIAEIRNKGLKIGYIQLGDEFNVKNTKELSNIVDFVLRPYFFPLLFNNINNVHWIPNGPVTGLGPRPAHLLRPSNKRRLLSTFLGWINNEKSFNSERTHFYQMAQVCKSDLVLYETPGFAQGLGVSAYSAVLEDSIIAPCPAGNSPETIRFYDALELGCIPVLLKHDWLLKNPYIDNNVPFPLLDSWSDFPPLISNIRKMLSESPSEILSIQADCIKWWSTLKISSKELAERCVNLIENG